MNYDHQPASRARALHLVVGTYTEHLPHVSGSADGIVGVTFDDISGRFGQVEALTVAHNPSYLVLSAAGTRLYALDETDAGPQGQGWLSAYSRDPHSGSLTLMSTTPSGGSGPTHLALSSSERFLLIAHYQSGSVAAFALDHFGDLGAMTGSLTHTGSGPRHERQEGPHTHMVHTFPAAWPSTTEEVLAVDLGIDAVLVHSLARDGQLEQQPELGIRTAPGAGPRHLAIHPDRRHIFLVAELDSTVTTMYRDADGRLRILGVTSTVGPAADCPLSHPSAVVVTNSGMYVIVANRGVDTLALLRFDSSRSRLGLVGNVPCGGRGPRDFALTPGGHLIVAALDDNALIAHRLDEQTATTTVTDMVSVASPACVVC